MEFGDKKSFKSFRGRGIQKNVVRALFFTPNPLELKKVLITENIYPD